MAKPTRRRPSTTKRGTKSSTKVPRARRAAAARTTSSQDEVTAWSSGALAPARARRGFTFLPPEPPSWSALLAFNAGRPRLYEFEAFLCGGLPVAKDASGPSLHFVSTWRRDDGTSPVFRVGDDEASVTPSFGTLRAALGLARDSSPKGALPPAFEPGRLYERLAWLERLFFGKSLGGDAEWASELRRLGTPAEWEAEQPLLATAPHLAAHWLLQHAFFRRTAQLTRALRASAPSTHPAVRELRALGDAVLAGRPPSFGDDPFFVARGTGARGPAPADWFPSWSTWLGERDPWRAKA